MNLYKQNFKLLYINKKHEICRFNNRSPETVSGAFLDWIPIQELGPQRNRDDCDRAPNIHSLMPDQEALEPSCLVKQSLPCRVPSTLKYETYVSLEDSELEILTQEEKTEKTKRRKWRSRNNCNQQQVLESGREEQQASGRRQKAGTAAPGYTKSSR